MLSHINGYVLSALQVLWYEMFERFRPMPLRNIIWFADCQSYFDYVCIWKILRSALTFFKSILEQ
jgi:hypothetical protein